MQKAIYYAIAFFLIFLAIQCVCVEKIAFRWEKNPIVETQTATTGGKSVAQPMEYTPPEWLKWSLFTPGLLFWMYAYSIKN